MLSILCEIAWPQWLFGNPWPLVAGLMMLFAALRLIGRRIGVPAAVKASWAALGLAALVLVGAQCIETLEEKLLRQTQALAAASIGPDFKTLDALLAPQVKVCVGDQSHVVLTGDKALRERLKQAQVKTLRCSNLEATLVDASNAWVRVSVEADGAQWEGAGMTTWRMQWANTATGWRATELRLVNAPLNMMGSVNLGGK